MKYWIKAFRLRTLPLATSGIILGASLAGFQNALVIALLILTATLLQICSNLANDYGDFQKGSDKNRKGEERMVSSGKIQPNQMKRAVFISAILGFCSGCTALLISPASMLVKLSILGVGILAVFAAITYTMGKISYGYRGLGDLFVVIFFGLVPVCTTQLLIGGEFSWWDLMPALALGMLASSVLNVNNIRDLEEDQKNGKITLAVRLGKHEARVYHAILLGLPFFISTSYLMLLQAHFLITLLPFASLLMLAPSGFKVFSFFEEELIDKQLKFHALGTTLYAILLAIGISYA